MSGTATVSLSLTVKSPPEDGFGLYGSGMFIFNPPWTLPRALAETLPFLIEALGQDASAGYTIQSKIA